MILETLLPAGFSALTQGCDYVVRYGCLIVLCPSESVADNVADDMDRIKRWLRKKAPRIDGVFVDGLDGRRFYSFRTAGKPCQLPYPFEVNQTMTLFDAIALGRVSPLPTMIYRIDDDLDDAILMFDNRDPNIPGETTSDWHAEPVAAPPVPRGFCPHIQELTTCQGEQFEIVQFVPVGAMEQIDLM